MQNTRLNNLLADLGDRAAASLRNPWRRLSLLAIGLLFGFFLGQAITTIAGQQAELDITVAGILMVVTESICWITYGANRRIGRSVLLETVNALRIGVTYSLFMEALKLAS